MRKKKEAKWEREKAEIKVGDIFCSCIGDRFIVTRVNDREFYILWYDGSTGHESKSKFDIQYYKKVGHIDISIWLTQIQIGGENDENESYQKCMAEYFKKKAMNQNDRD